jgi:hypothetical protein
MNDHDERSGDQGSRLRSGGAAVMEQENILFGPKRVCVIVCGMHRTGTSAVTRVINLLGADVAKDLVPPQVDNIRGFWEPRELVRIHNELLQALGSSSADPLPLPDDWLNSPAAERAQRQLTGVIDAEFSESRLFVVKDPRVARLLPLWLKLLDDIGVGAAVVIPFRNPLEVAASLEKRDHMPAGTSMLLYLESYLKAELASRGKRRCFVSYDQVLRDWRQLERKLQELLGVRLPARGADQAAAVERFLSPNLRHHWHCNGELRGFADAPPSIIAKLFDVLNDAAVTDDGPRLQMRFDELRKSADDAATLFRELVVGERERARSFELSASWRVTAPLRWVKSGVLHRRHP